jgi:hypothetical protein
VLTRGSVLAAAQRELRAAQVEIDQRAAHRAPANAAEQLRGGVPLAGLNGQLRAQEQQPQVV